MAEYRKKPVTVDAVQFNGDFQVIEDFFGGDGPWEGGYDADTSWLIIHTWEGDMKATLGDWIIRGVKGEYYPCKPDIFEATYERVSTED